MKKIILNIASKIKFLWVEYSMREVFLVYIAVITIILLFATFGTIYAQDFGDKLAKAAVERTNHIVIYDGSYTQLDYPNGDVSRFKGVCTDVIIRSYRNAHKIDLQKYVHEDMIKNFNKYPKLWQLKAPDKNIDHRRTQNLECFLTRMGAKLSNSTNPKDYKPGDIVFWGEIGFGHVGIVSHNMSWMHEIPLIVHNIGWGVREENFLFDSKITGHYRWNPKT